MKLSVLEKNITFLKLPLAIQCTILKIVFLMTITIFNIITIGVLGVELRFEMFIRHDMTVSV